MLYFLIFKPVGLHRINKILQLDGIFRSQVPSLKFFFEGFQNFLKDLSLGDRRSKKSSIDDPKKKFDRQSKKKFDRRSKKFSMENFDRASLKIFVLAKIFFIGTFPDTQAWAIDNPKNFPWKISIEPLKNFCPRKNFFYRDFSRHSSLGDRRSKKKFDRRSKKKFDRRSKKKFDRRSKKKFDSPSLKPSKNVAKKKFYFLNFKIADFFM